MSLLPSAISPDAFLTSTVLSFIVWSVSVICFEPSFCSSIADFICMTSASVSASFFETASNATLASEDAETTSFIESLMFVSWSPIVFDWTVDVSESFLISSATTANPFPASPA